MQCFICGEEPLTGTRYHCNDCPDKVDLCADCAVIQLEAEDPIHCPSHKMTAVRPPNNARSYDLDYFPQNFASASYLDPNFLPEWFSPGKSFQILFKSFFLRQSGSRTIRRTLQSDLLLKVGESPGLQVLSNRLEELHVEMSIVTAKELHRVWIFSLNFVTTFCKALTSLRG